MEAWRQSKARLEMPVPLGYSCAGIISEVNNADEDFHLGDRVACSGSGYASHAEYNVIPSNLCVKIPRRKLNVISYKLHEEGRQEIVNRYTLYVKDQERITDNESTDNLSASRKLHTLPLVALLWKRSGWQRQSLGTRSG
jgi:hypothetical protein